MIWEILNWPYFYLRVRMKWSSNLCTAWVNSSFESMSWPRKEINFQNVYHLRLYLKQLQYTSLWQIGRHFYNCVIWNYEIRTIKADVAYTKGMGNFSTLWKSEFVCPALILNLFPTNVNTVFYCLKCLVVPPFYIVIISSFVLLF